MVSKTGRGVTSSDASIRTCSLFPGCSLTVFSATREGKNVVQVRCASTSSPAAQAEVGNRDSRLLGSIFPYSALLLVCRAVPFHLRHSMASLGELFRFRDVGRNSSELIRAIQTYKIRIPLQIILLTHTGSSRLHGNGSAVRDNGICCLRSRPDSHYSLLSICHLQVKFQLKRDALGVYLYCQSVRLLVRRSCRKTLAAFEAWESACCCGLVCWHCAERWKSCTSTRLIRVGHLSRRRCLEEGKSRCVLVAQLRRTAAINGAYIPVADRSDSRPSTNSVSLNPQRQLLTPAARLSLRAHFPSMQFNFAELSPRPFSAEGADGHQAGGGGTAWLVTVTSSNGSGEQFNE